MGLDCPVCWELRAEGLEAPFHFLFHLLSIWALECGSQDDTSHGGGFFLIQEPAEKRFE